MDVRYRGQKKAGRLRAARRDELDHLQCLTRCRARPRGREFYENLCVHSEIPLRHVLFFTLSPSSMGIKELAIFPIIEGAPRGETMLLLKKLIGEINIRLAI